MYTIKASHYILRQRCSQLIFKNEKGEKMSSRQVVCDYGFSDNSVNEIGKSDDNSCQQLNPLHSLICQLVLRISKRPSSPSKPPLLCHLKIENVLKRK